MGFVVNVHVNNRRQQQLAAMPVWIEYVDVIGMADAVLAGSILHLTTPAELTHRVARAHHGLNVGNDVAEMVECRPVTLEEDEIVRRILNLQEHADWVVAGGDVIGYPAADRCVEPGPFFNLRDGNLVVVEATGLRTLVLMNFHIETRLPVHRRANLERRAANISRVQSSALERTLDPRAG